MEEEEKEEEKQEVVLSCYKRSRDAFHSNEKFSIKFLTTRCRAKVLETFRRLASNLFV